MHVENEKPNEETTEAVQADDNVSQDAAEVQPIVERQDDADVVEENIGLAPDAEHESNEAVEERETEPAPVVDDPIVEVVPVKKKSDSLIWAIVGILIIVLIGWAYWYFNNKNKIENGTEENI